NQKFNRLDVELTAPGGKVAANPTATPKPTPAQATPTPQPATRPTPQTATNTQNPSATGQTTYPQINPGTTNPAQQGTTGNPAVVYAPTPDASASPAVSPEASPVASPPYSEQVAQAQQPPVSQPATTAPSTTGTSLGTMLRQNWLVILIAAVVLLSLVMIVAARSRAQRTAGDTAVDTPARRDRRKEKRAAKKKAAAELEEAEPAVPVADILYSSSTMPKAKPLATAGAAAVEDAVAVEEEEKAAPVIAEEETKEVEAVAPAVDVERVDVEIKNVLAGESYDEEIIGASDAGTRQLIATELLAALASRSPERRERAREVFIKHEYLDEATRNLRTADAPAERAASARSLGYVHDRSVTPHLVAALDDESPEVRRAAVESLAELKDPAAVESLKSLLERERDRKVPKNLIKRAIEASVAVEEEEEEAPTLEAQIPAVEAEPSSAALADVSSPEIVPGLISAAAPLVTEEVDAEAQEAARREAEAAEEAARQQAAEEEAARQRAEEEERARVAAEEEQRRQAEAEAERLRAAEEEQRRVQEEEEQKRAAAEAVRLQEEEARVRAEEETRLKAAEEARLKAEEEERVRVEAEARRQAEEEARLAAEAEARRKAEEEEAARQRAEEERVRAEMEARRRAEEEEAARLLAIQEERRRQAEEETRLAAEAKAEEERRLAEAEAARVQAEEEARLFAEAEAAERRAQEEEARKRAEEAEARRKAEEEERLAAELEAKRQAEEEEARRLIAEEAAAVLNAEAISPVDVEVAEETLEIAPDSLIERNDEVPSGWIEVDVNEPEVVRHAEPPQATLMDEAVALEELKFEPALEVAEADVQESKEIEPAAFSIVEEPEAHPVSKEIDFAVTERGIETYDEFSAVPLGIMKRLGSEEPDERAAAVRDLSRVGGDDSFRQINAAFDDPAVEVRNAAARSLYNLNADRAATYTRALRDSPPERRRRIGAALASSGLASEAIGQLMGESREKTYDAFSLLFLMSKAGEVQPLMRAIEEHPNNEVRLAVVKLLALSGQQEILPAFRRLAVRGSLPTEVRSAVMEAIYQISSQSPTAA
ncbi:MAG TPA: HEAT repeat domain-containing protein, partial [Pyrinomonadaceae bacterium]|nr:HEAT repeat domain-containing protein [Pyrinomonadaceae bacterium]